MDIVIIICSILCIITFILFLFFLYNPIRKKNKLKRNNFFLMTNQKKILIFGLCSIIFLLFFDIFCINSTQSSQKTQTKDSSLTSSSSSSSNSSIETSTKSSTSGSVSSSNNSEASSSSFFSSSEQTSGSQNDGQNNANGISINDYFESDDSGKAVVTGTAPSDTKSIYVKNSYDDSSLTANVNNDGTFRFEYQLQSADSEITLFLIAENEKDGIPFDQWVMTDVIPSTNYERKVEDASKDKEAQELDDYNKKQQEKLNESVDEEDGGN